ncbi:MAG: YceD family protein [Methylotenera sp.]|nr:YceD family protein [Methylotenera sp.]
MTKQTIIIDNLAFVKRNERLTGELSLHDCPRLSALLDADAKNTSNKYSPSATLKFDLSGKQGVHGQALLSLSLQANITCLCQRCLKEMPLILALNFNYSISDMTEDDLMTNAIDEADDIDLQPISPHMDVIALMEDELIMALPIAPIHEQACASLVNQSGEKPNPFAVLKSLIKP